MPARRFARRRRQAPRNAPRRAEVMGEAEQLLATAEQEPAARRLPRGAPGCDLGSPASRRGLAASRSVANN